MARYPVGCILQISTRKDITEDGSSVFNEGQIDQLVKRFGNPETLNRLHGREATKEVLCRLLRTFPEPEKQRKIISRITRETKKRGYNIRNLFWWDIDPPQRALCADVKRESLTIPVVLMWKKTDRNAKTIPFAGTQWIPDASSPIGYHMECEATVYELMISNFITWLEQPLDIPQYLSRSA